jgi:hypothetical protein
MAKDAYIKLEGAEDLIRGLGVGGFTKAAGGGLKAGAAHIAAQNAKYPPTRKRRQPFKTDKSRHWFFAALRRGEIQVPYRRTKKLGQAWTVRLQRWHTAIISNKMPYARYVQDEDDQSEYHKGNWSTAQANLREHLGAVGDKVLGAIQKWAARK